MRKKVKYDFIVFNFMFLYIRGLKEAGGKLYSYPTFYSPTYNDIEEIFDYLSKKIE